MKNLLFATLLSLSAMAVAQDRPTLTPQQKLVVVEAAVALVTGPIVLPVAVVTGQREALCHILEGPILSRRSSFDDNSEGRDQCPRGNWLRIIPFLKEKQQ